MLGNVYMYVLFMCVCIRFFVFFYGGGGRGVGCVEEERFFFLVGRSLFLVKWMCR